MSAQPFDVIFTRSKLTESFGSIAIEPLADPEAWNATRRFSHVSIALDERFGLEAVPTEDDPKPGAFSGIVLGAGVRLVPLLDLSTAAREEGTAFVVLRSVGAKTAAAYGNFTWRSKVVLEIFDSEYSLGPMKESVEANLRALPEPVLEKLRSKFTWTSPRGDLASLISRADVRSSLEKAIPGYTFPFETHSFYCSKLVSFLLHRCGLFQTDDIERVGPSGLFHRLVRSGDWTDVTESDYVTSSRDALSTISSILLANEYHAHMHEIRVRRMLLGLDAALELGGLIKEKIDADLDRFAVLFNDLDLGNPARSIARSRETELADELTRCADIKSSMPRAAFTRSARDIVRMFGWGLLTYEQFMKMLVDAVPKYEERAPST
jgi:hypothetical protein